jgi:transcriptional regulator of acetoin/glycerol metabolism
MIIEDDEAIHRDAAEEGLKALDEIMNAAPETKVVLLTGNGHHGQGQAHRGARPQHRDGRGGSDAVALRQAWHKAGREAVVEALVRTRGNISQATQLLGVSRPTVHGMIVNAKEFR